MRRTDKILGCAVVILLISVIGLYLVLLSMEAYSQRQASRLLDKVEAIRLGDPEANFDSAVKGLPVKKTASGTLATVTSGAYRFPTLWSVIDKLPEAAANWMWTFCNRAGLRYWRLDVSSSSDHGHISDLWANVHIVGRYESLGAEWRISPTLPQLYQAHIREPYDQRTYMSWYHITSRPNGEGFAIYGTPASSDSELMARQINRKCFLSFRGCDGLCELLPNAISVLVERHRDWGGGTCVPRSPCDFKNKWNPCAKVYSPVVPATN